MRHGGLILALTTGSVMLTAAGAAVAQQAQKNVMLPWQQGRAKPLPPQPQPKTSTAQPEVLPWLSGPETLPWQPQGAKADTARIETGAVATAPKQTEAKPAGPATNGLVLKKTAPVAAPVPPMLPAEPVVKAVAQAAPADAGDRSISSDAAFDAEPTPMASETERPIVVKPAAAKATKFVPEGVVPSSDATFAKPAAAGATGTALVPQGQVEQAATPATAARPAEADGSAEEAAPIPPPLPAAVVSTVATPNVNATVSRALVPKPVAPKLLPTDANVAQQYCFNIADAAKDARYAWQKKTLADIEVELNKRIALLDERTAEYQKWLARRDEFIRQAEDGVVKIYTGMKPDAAAVQLTLMQEETAAAILTKLGTRPAAAILNEMDPTKAAKLTMIITGAAKLKKKQQMAPAAAGGPETVPARPEAAATNGQRS